VRVQNWKSVLISLHEALLQGVCKDDMLYRLKWAMMLSCRHRRVDHRDSTFALGAYFLHICFILPAAGLDFSLVGENIFFARAGRLRSFFRGVVCLGARWMWRLPCFLGLGVG
jgi:hypothetical protein